MSLRNILLISMTLLGTQLAAAADPAPTQPETLPDTLTIVCKNPTTQAMDVESGSHVEFHDGIVSVYRLSKDPNVDLVFVRDMSGDCSVEQMAKCSLTGSSGLI